MQAGTGSGSATQLFRHMVKAEGGWRMWRGVHTMLVGCLPAHAAYFGIYEASTHDASCRHAERSSAPRIAVKAKTTSVGTTHSTLGVMLAGATAVCVHDSIMTPMDVMKQRLQLGYYRGILDCAVSVARTEGLIAFYRSYPTTLVMNVPFHGTLVMINESLKSLFGPREVRHVVNHVVLVVCTAMPSHIYEMAMYAR